MFIKSLESFVCEINIAGRIATRALFGVKELPGNKIDRFEVHTVYRR